ncbi:hypothetical protein [Butyrivibrio sp. AD3002]|uniref:hypothetical protein n=1 Tax=Butyrivibrio sp. AD3002 TaxID=1280670 RepID=UPI0003B4D7EE|nr:hypothetical protein [Butyrivibrio sp. AD3002]
MKRRVWQRVLSLALLFAMTIILVNPVTAQAKTKKLKLPFAAVGHPYESYMESKAVTVTKTGSYKVVETKSSDYYGGVIKFVVPKTKKYAFTFSHVRAKGKSPCLPYAEFSVPSGAEDGITYVSGHTKKYRGDNQYPFGYRVPGKQNVATRTITYDLTEGQVLYIHVVNAYYSTKGKKMTFNLKIK